MDLIGLHRWLVRVFAVADIYRVVRLGPSGEQVAADLPASGTPNEIAYAATMAWDRHAVLGRELLEHLLSERPNWRGELFELWGELEISEPALPRPDGVQVAIDIQLAWPVLNESQTIHLCLYLRRLAEETAPGANIDICVTKLEEMIGCVLATVELTILGNFEDVKVAEAQVDKFHTRPWAEPAVAITIDYDQQRLIFTAYAVVSAEHLYPSS